MPGVSVGAARGRIGAVVVAHRRRPRAAIGPLVTRIRPNPSRLGVAGARSQHRHRCVVGVEAVTRDDMPLQRVDQRAQQGEDLANPVGQRRAFQRDPGARIDVALTIQR
jgi:hypothetical protein